MPDPVPGIRFTGAVYTPKAVAAALVNRIDQLRPNRPIRILEPSVGDGAFLRELRLRRQGDQFTLVDIDEEIIRQQSEEDGASNGCRATFIVDDFLSYAEPLIRSGTRPFDLIIGNPPFIRSRNFSKSLKGSVAAIGEALAYPKAELKNSWAAFLAVCSRLVADRGMMAFVLPYELITVAYGRTALRSLLGAFRRVDIYVSRAKAFPEIDQDALVLIAQKESDAPGLFINRVDTLAALTEGTAKALDLRDGSDQALELNAFLLPVETLDLLRRLRGAIPRLDSYAGSAPGVVSAANEFFILRKAEVERRGFEDVVIPVLKKGSFASHAPIFSAADFEVLRAREPCFLLTLRGPAETLSPAVQAYILEGEKKDIHLRYKCRKRSRWYEVPLVKKEPGFIFKRAYSYPRLCVNAADVYLTDTAYGLRVKDGYSIRGLSFSFYNSLTLLFAEIDGRFYGGGVLELSPTEFRGLPLVYHEPSEAEYDAFLAAHEKASGNPDPILDFGDAWLEQNAALSPEDMKRLRQAWIDLRSHRLRHSGNIADPLAAPTPTLAPTRREWAAGVSQAARPLIPS